MSPGGVARSTDIYWPKTKPMPPECALKVIDGVVDRPGFTWAMVNRVALSFFGLHKVISLVHKVLSASKNKYFTQIAACSGSFESI